MGVFDFEEKRLRQQEIEVKAFVKAEATKALCEYGFPSKVAEEINQETLEGFE